MPASAKTRKAKRNTDFDWDKFDPVEYVNANYARLGAEDRSILEDMRDFLASADVSRPGRQVRGVDVGSGPNIYPALAMVPFCDEITLSDISKANVNWLRNEIPSYSPTWDQYWKVLERNQAYGGVKDPRRSLKRRVRVIRSDLFALPQAQWDLGTMFFVAESMSEDWSEFHRATRWFVGTLKRDAPFAAAFMESSEGYYVGGRPFPAVGIGEGDVAKCLDNVAHDVRIRRLDPDQEHPLRHGYTGMILALGRAGAAKR